MLQTMLVIGGAGGVGKAVVERARDCGLHVTAADLQDQADTDAQFYVQLDIINGAAISAVMKGGHWDHVVVAAGVNEAGLGRRSLAHLMEVNYLGPMDALWHWARQERSYVPLDHGKTRHFVVVSSNSAHIPRSKSVGYCASKAALSMGVRAFARNANPGRTIWGVEPGWVSGTPMSDGVLEWLERNDPGTPPHRIPGDRTLKPEDLAWVIVDGILDDRQYYNGCMLRLDGGEI